MNFRQGLSSILHFRQYKASKLRIWREAYTSKCADSNELPARNCVALRQRNASSDRSYCDFTHPLAAIGSKRLPQGQQKSALLISQNSPQRENARIRLPKVQIGSNG